MRSAIMLVAVFVGVAVYATKLPSVILGDYDAELRGPDGRVDIPFLLQRLQEMGANTYFWLIWHAPTDWEDLQRFLPEAQKANIQVWAYLCPPSEQGPEGKFPFCEPYRLDFVRWAQEIAKLSLRYPNLVGWVIDDFWANFHEKAISPALVRQMQQTAKAINPELRFYPLMYFPEIGLRFTLELAPLVDGVVAAYHQSREEIESVLPYLDDSYRLGPALLVQFPRSTRSAPGDHGCVTQKALVREEGHPRIRFRYWDDYDGPTAGYHLMQLRIDDQIAWAEDIAGRDDGEANIDLAPFVEGKKEITFALGVWDEKGVSEYGIAVQFTELHIEGLELNTDLSDPAAWKAQTQGAFQIRHISPQAGEKRFRLPLIVMPAGSRGEYKHRYHEEATPEKIAARTRQALELVGDGRVIGTVLYCLDKSAKSEDLPAISRLFREFQKP